MGPDNKTNIFVLQVTNGEVQLANPGSHCTAGWTIAAPLKLLLHFLPEMTNDFLPLICQDMGSAHITRQVNVYIFI